MRYAGTGSRVVIALVSAVILFQRGTVRAGELTISLAIRDSATTDAGQKGYVLDLGDLAKLAGNEIVYAQLTLGVHGGACSDSAGGILMWPMNRPWSKGSASPALALDTATTSARIKGFMSVALPSAGAADPSLVVTELVQEWVDSSIPNYGLFITTPFKNCDWGVSPMSTALDSGIGNLYVRYIEKQR